MSALKRIYTALWRELDAAGRGAISRVQRAAMVGPSYLRDLRARDRADTAKGELAKLLRIVQALEIEPREFFASAFGRGEKDPIRQLKIETRRLGKPPEIVVRVRTLLLDQGWEPLPEMPEAVRKLDDLRYTSPKDARESTHGMLIEVCAGILPPSWGMPLLAVYGSALRMDGRLLNRAQLTLIAAYEIAEKNGDPSTLGNLVQRSAYVVADRGEYHQALILAKWAAGFYVVADDRVGIGKALADQGMWLHHLSRFQESVRVNMAALKYLPEDARSNRFCVLAGLGEDYFFLGDLESAQGYAEKAEDYSSDVGLWFRFQLLWSKARIAAVKKDHNPAEMKFRQVVGYFFETSPLDYALSSVELVHILLAQGKIHEAYTVAMDTLRIIEPLEENKLASAAMVEFWRCAQIGRGLSLALTEKTIRELARAGGRLPPTPMLKL